MKLNIVKSKEKDGTIVYRIRDNKGKHVKYLGTAEKILQVFNLFDGTRETIKAVKI